MKFKTLLAAGALAAALSFTFATPQAALAAPAGQEAAAQAQKAPNPGDQKSWTGTVDAKQMGGETVYVFTVGGNTYTLQPSDKAKEFVGKTVKITGTMSGTTVNISSIEEA